MAQVTGGMAPYQFTWSSGVSRGANNESVEISKSGFVTLRVLDNLGCTAEYTFEVKFPKVGIEYRIENCNQHRFSFGAHVAYGLPEDYTFLWNFGDGQTSATQYAEHAFSSPGTYKVTLKMTNDTCETIFEKDVEISAIPVLTLDRIPVFCPGDSMLLHVSGAYSYQWFDGSATDSIVIKTLGDYSVLGTNKYGCSSILNFTAKHFGLYGFAILSDKDAVSIDNSEVLFWSDNSSGIEYLWNFGDGTMGAGNSQRHTYSVTGEGYYDVNLRVKNTDGCEEYATKRIWITNGSLKNTFTPNGDGVDDIYMRGWDIKIYNRNGLLIYEGNEGWDGTYKGKPVSNDTYFVVVYYPTAQGTKTNTGYITVIR
ncbi:MAG: PKD domain-containing protein [Paludibacteraceae bacterium]